MGKAAIRECGYTRNTAWKEKSRRLRRKKGSHPRLAALGSPFQGKGLAWTLPPSYGRRCPEGAEVGWGSGMKESGKDRLKSTIYESTLSTAARSPFPMGKAAKREYRFSRHKAFPAWGRWRAERAG